MSARRKLNQFHTLGNALLAAIAGLSTGSWMVFLLVLAILMGLSLHAGEIRPKEMKRRTKRPN